jgi:hypothetical protein
LITDKFFRKLNEKYPTPFAVQKYLKSFPYNRETEGETQRSARSALKAGKLHCLEAAFVAAAILELSGYPPLILSLESQDDLDHVVYIFKEKSGWGSIGRSRMLGLHGRRPIFKSIHQLALSYYDCFIDETGRVTGYGVANLEKMMAPWRDSPRNLWKVENYLIALKHKPMVVSKSRYQKWYNFFKTTGQSGIPQRTWW